MPCRYGCGGPVRICGPCLALRARKYVGVDVAEYNRTHTSELVECECGVRHNVIDTASHKRTIAHLRAVNGRRASEWAVKRFMRACADDPDAAIKIAIKHKIAKIDLEACGMLDATYRLSERAGFEFYKWIIDRFLPEDAYDVLATMCVPPSLRREDRGFAMRLLAARKPQSLCREDFLFLMRNCCSANRPDVARYVLDAHPEYDLAVANIKYLLFASINGNAIGSFLWLYENFGGDSLDMNRFYLSACNRGAHAITDWVFANCQVGWKPFMLGILLRLLDFLAGGSTRDWITRHTAGPLFDQIQADRRTCLDRIVDIIENPGDIVGSIPPRCADLFRLAVDRAVARRHDAVRHIKPLG